MSDQPTVEERIARLEEAIYNHVLHSLRSLDAKVWAILILVSGALLGFLLK